MRIVGDIPELLAGRCGYEPQVRAFSPFLVGHRARLEMSIRTARRHHRHLDVIDQTVELLDLGFHVLHSSARASLRLRIEPVSRMRPIPGAHGPAHELHQRRHHSVLFRVAIRRGPQSLRG
jgi:hypothetical protein